MKNTTKAIASLALVLLGMAGLHYGIEYSGWVLAIGLWVAVDL